MVPGFGSRAGARNCSVGSRSCMASLSRQREHSVNGQGRTRAPPAAYHIVFDLHDLLDALVARDLGRVEALQRRSGP
jgi:hypothetical protein